MRVWTLDVGVSPECEVLDPGYEGLDPRREGLDVGLNPGCGGLDLDMGVDLGCGSGLCLKSFS